MASATTPGEGGGLKAIGRLSAAIAWCEARFAGVLMVLILALLLTNVVSRAFGKPLIWTDELAVYLMVMAAFVGASLGLEKRQHIAVTLLSDAVSASTRRKLAFIVDVVLLALFAIFAWTLWIWFDPLGVLAAEDLRTYARESFNFLYQEPTVTLGVRKFWFWLVLPVFCLTGFVHVLARFGATAEQSK
jgi:TRAP-type C4-dicarboxylate transport system, small permease component